MAEKYTLAQAQAIKRYREKNNYIELRCRVSPEKRDEIFTHAQQQNKSLNVFIAEAINEKIERDTKKD